MNTIKYLLGIFLPMLLTACASMPISQPLNLRAEIKQKSFILPIDTILTCALPLMNDIIISSFSKSNKEYKIKSYPEKNYLTLLVTNRSNAFAVIKAIFITKNDRIDVHIVQRDYDCSLLGCVKNDFLYNLGDLEDRCINEK